jgi:hypothetical protein
MHRSMVATRLRLLRLTLLASTALLISSCGKDDDTVPVHPVSGQILLEGNRPPPEGAVVILRPVKETPLLKKTGFPRGTVGKDGRFHHQFASDRADRNAGQGLQQHDRVLVRHVQLGL